MFQFENLFNPTSLIFGFIIVFLIVVILGKTILGFVAKKSFNIFGKGRTRSEGMIYALAQFGLICLLVVVICIAAFLNIGVDTEFIIDNTTWVVIGIIVVAMFSMLCLTALHKRGTPLEIIKEHMPYEGGFNNYGKVKRKRWKRFK